MLGETWENRFPFLGSAGRVQLEKRVEACASHFLGPLGVSPAQWAAKRKLGCGNYGCTWLIEGMPVDKAVFKATTDNLEARVVKLLTEWGEKKPDGIVRYAGIWQLGRCSVLPRMQAFKYTRREGPSYAPVQRTEYYKGPGAPFRPVWILQREELPDAWATLRARGVKQKTVKDAMSALYTWARLRAVDWGAPGAHQNAWALKPLDWDALLVRMEPVGGVELVHALDWLMERQIGFYDFQKLANLGWREGTGLVIRDIGFAATEMDTEEDPMMLGYVGAGGRWMRSPGGR